MQASLNEWGEYWEEEEKWDIVIYKEHVYALGHLVDQNIFLIIFGLHP